MTKELHGAGYSRVTGRSFRHLQELIFFRPEACASAGDAVEAGISIW